MRAFRTRALGGMYWLAIHASVPLMVLRLLWRSRWDSGYRAALGERFGLVRQNAPAEDDAKAESGCLWLHAVSVGEANAAAPLIDALRREAPALALRCTVTTPTGRRRMQEVAPGASVSFAPWDLPSAVARFLRGVRPRALVLLETELWPHWLLACRRRGIPVFLVSARLSERSFRRYQRVASLFRHGAGHNLRVLCQGEEDQARFRELFPEAMVALTGNLKFDLASPSPQTGSNASTCEAPDCAARIIVAGSTHPGEEAPLLRAWNTLRAREPSLALILAPRHPDRRDAIVRLAESLAIPLRLRSAGMDPAPGTVLLLDTLGELRSFYERGTLAFVGGTLVPVGGHSLIEPAALGLPIVAGPELYKTRDVARTLEAVGALRIVEDEEALQATLAHWLDDDMARRRAGAAARSVVDTHRGAAERSVRLILEALEGGREGTP